MSVKDILRKRGGLDGVIFAIIMIVIVMTATPFFRALMNDNATAAKNIGTQITNVTKP